MIYTICFGWMKKLAALFLFFLCAFECPASAESPWRYHVRTSFENLNYLLNRASHSINDQETFEIEPGVTFDNKNNFKLTLKPRVKIDFLDSNRNRYIPDEASLLFYSSSFELRAGFDKVSWGVSNFFSPTDVVSRSDLGGNFYDADKMGELLLSSKLPLGGGSVVKEIALTFGVLPWLQETPLPANSSRFAIAGDFSGVPFTLDDGADKKSYLKSIGAFAKLAGSVAGADAALTFYHGPDHIPAFYITTDSGGALRARPYYYTLDMVGLSAKGALGNFSPHVEIAYRMTGANAFKTHDIPGTTDNIIPQSSLQHVTGLDYTIDGAFGGGTLSFTAEFLGEDFGATAFQDFRPFKRDLLLGARYEFNNVRLTRIELGTLKDLENTELISMINFETELYKDLRLNVQAAIVNRDGTSGQPISFFENNSYVMTKISYEFGGKI